MTSHTCHWPECTKEVPPAMWGCRGHWYALPKFLRDKVWAAYERGQEITKSPSEKYIEVAHEVQEWILNSKTYANEQAKRKEISHD